MGCKVSVNVFGCSIDVYTTLLELNFMLMVWILLKLFYTQCSWSPNSSAWQMADLSSWESAHSTICKEEWRECTLKGMWSQVMCWLNTRLYWQGSQIGMSVDYGPRLGFHWRHEPFCVNKTHLLLKVCDQICGRCYESLVLTKGLSLIRALHKISIERLSNFFS